MDTIRPVLTRLAGPPWIVAIAAFIVWIVLLFAAKWLIFFWARRAARIRWSWLAATLPILSPAANVVIVTAAIALASRTRAVPPRWTTPINIVFTGGVVLALIIFVDGIVRLWMRRAAARFPLLDESYGPVTGIVRGLVVGIGLLMFLQSVGISVTPIIASLGVGSLAIALALQETVKNIISGLFVIMDKTLQVNDFVRLQSGQEGWLTKLGWRSSRIQSADNRVVVVPNSQLVDSIVTNYRASDRGVTVVIDLSLVSANDLEQVERVTVEVAREVIATVEGCVRGFQPSVFFSGVSGGLISLTVSLQATNAEAVHNVRHEFIKRVTARYQREGVKIP
jgi:small-conductance mechanosensitive channel